VEMADPSGEARGHPVSDHPAARATRASMKALGSESADLRWERCVVSAKAKQPVPTLAGREHLASAAGYVRLRTKLVATEHQQADCGPHEPGNPGNVGFQRSKKAHMLPLFLVSKTFAQVRSTRIFCD
jgi:hypothetical protein